MSFEFLLAAIAVLLIFLALFGVYQGKQETFADSSQTLVAKQIAYKISRAANAAMASQNGTAAQAIFGNASEELGGAYVICANNSLVEVRWKNNSRSVSFPMLSSRAFSQTGSSIASCTQANVYNATAKNVNGELYFD